MGTAAVVLICIAYIVGLGFWVMDGIDRFMAQGRIKPWFSRDDVRDEPDYGGRRGAA